MTLTDSAPLPVFANVDVLVAGGGPAGVAAALAVRKGVRPGALDPAELRAALREQGGILDESDIAAAEGRDAASGRQYKGGGYVL